MATIVCLHCGRKVLRNKKLKHLEQRYCRLAECQKARRLAFGRKKYKEDQQYRSRKLSKVAARHTNSRLEHSEYMRRYRKSHLEYVDRNRDTQRERNRKRQKTSKIVNPYALIAQRSDNQHVYAMFAIDCKKIVNPYTLMPEHIDKLLLTDTKPVLVQLL